MRLNLGSGYNKMGGFVNIDNRSCVSPDIVVDVEKGLPFQDNSINEVVAKDFLEHIPIGKTVFVIEEIYRVLEKDGVFFSFTPSTDGRGAFQDPTHVSFWNKNSWLYYTVDEYRDLYDIKAKFKGSISDLVVDKDQNLVYTRTILRAIK